MTKDIRRCDYCSGETRDDMAFDWWELQRVYPVTIEQAKNDHYDFCSLLHFQSWAQERQDGSLSPNL